MKKLVSLIALFLALMLLLNGCSYLLVPKDAVVFSKDAIKNTLTEMVRNGETARAVLVTDVPENISESIYSFIDELYMTDGVFLYYVSQVANTVISSPLYSEILFNIEYNSATVPYSEIHIAYSDLDVVNAIITNLSKGLSETVISCPSGGYDGNDAFMFGDCADLNANQPCSSDAINYQVFPNADIPNQLLIISYSYSVDEITRNRISSEIDKATATLAEKISFADVYNTDEELYRAIHDAVIENAYYDYELYDGLSFGEISDEQKIEKSAYGVLVNGKSVCSGYAYAFKALCDYFELPCWVLSCSYGEDGHIVNIVLLNGKTYYVDCTFDDTGYSSSEYFLFSEDDYQYNEYDFSNRNVIPW